MTESEKAYIAGIIESKGSIMLLRDNNSKFPSPNVSISSTALELLEYIYNTLGSGSIRKRKGHSLDEYKDYYEFTLKRDDAIYFLNSIYPYLITPLKKSRANLIISKYKDLTPRNGKYTPEMVRLKEDFYNEFMSLK
ncbi:MAG: LAGLIDADG family homing endonuclease [Clostridium sp.]